jgi:Uma2 family endonuclease
VAYDRNVKGPLYARQGIREYWLLDLRAKVLEVSRKPGSDRYGEVQRLRRGDSVAPEAFPEVVFPVSDLLGPSD